MHTIEPYRLVALKNVEQLYIITKYRTNNLHNLSDMNIKSSTWLYEKYHSFCTVRHIVTSMLCLFRISKSIPLKIHKFNVLLVYFEILNLFNQVFSVFEIVCLSSHFIFSYPILTPQPHSIHITTFKQERYPLFELYSVVQ